MLLRKLYKSSLLTLYVPLPPQWLISYLLLQHHLSLQSNFLLCNCKFFFVFHKHQTAKNYFFCPEWLSILLLSNSSLSSQLRHHVLQIITPGKAPVPLPLHHILTSITIKNILLKSYLYSRHANQPVRSSSVGSRLSYDLVFSFYWIKQLTP